MQIDKRGITHSLRVSVGHRNNGSLLQPEYISEIVRPVSIERKFSRPGFPNTVVIPNSRRRWITASRTVTASAPGTVDEFAEMLMSIRSVIAISSSSTIARPNQASYGKLPCSFTRAAQSTPANHPYRADHHDLLLLALGYHHDFSRFVPLLGVFASDLRERRIPRRLFTFVLFSSTADFVWAAAIQFLQADRTNS